MRRRNKMKSRQWLVYGYRYKKPEPASGSSLRHERKIDLTAEQKAQRAKRVEELRERETAISLSGELDRSIFDEPA